MPLLGIFGRKNKPSSRSQHHDDVSSLKTGDDHDSASTLSPTASYISPGKALPSSPNGRPANPLSPSQQHSVYPGAGAAASSSKLRLFGRKKNATSAPNGFNTSTTSINTTGHIQPARPAYISRLSTSTAPDLDGDMSDVNSHSHHQNYPRGMNGNLNMGQNRMRPPPSKSAIFAAYNDPSGALSTRSLPAPMTSPTSPLLIPQDQQRKHQETPLTPPSPPVPAPPPKKSRPSIFPWSKSTPSSPATKPSAPQTPEQDNSSFNLKSFRHVRAPSPPILPPAFNLNNNNSSTGSLTLTPPLPRPRGASVNSESSQRISVAAFREAQARRSLAGSPAPEFRSGSPSPVPVPQLGTSVSGGAGNGSLAGRRENPVRRSTAPVSTLYTSSTDDEEEEDDEDSDDEDDTMRPQLDRKRTITERSRTYSRPGKSKRAQSELGHGMASSAPRYTSSPRSHLGHGAISYTQPLRGGDDEDESSSGGKWPPRSQSSLGTYGNGSRQRASVSTSAMTPSAAAKRASVIASANSMGGDPLANYKRASRHVRDSSTYSNPGAPPVTASETKKPADDDSSDDDTPLGTLLPPRRPGSAMSSYSNTSRSNVNLNNSHTNLPIPPGSNPNSRPDSQIPGSPAQYKPLIDISELTKKAPRASSPKKNDEAFTGGLLASGQGQGGRMAESPLSSPTMLAASTPSVFGVVSKHPPGRFISPPASPAKEIQALNMLSTSPSSTTELQTTPGQERKDSAMSVLSSSPATATSPTSISAEKRDVFGDRLARVVKNQIRSSSRPAAGRTDSSDSTGRSSTASPPPPLPSQNRDMERGRTTSPVQRINTEYPARNTPSPSPRPVFESRTSGGGKAQEPSTPDEELARVLGAGIKLISVAGGSDSEEDENDREKEEEENREKEQREQKVKEDSIFLPPIPIKQRSPPPAFSVTSRPQHPRNSLSIDSTATLTPSNALSGDQDSWATTAATGGAGAPQMRQRSSTLIPASSSPMASFPNTTKSTAVTNTGTSSSSSSNLGTSISDLKGSGSNNTLTSSQPTPRPGMGGRQRSSTMVPISSPTASKIGMGMPSRPFAAPQRRDSPASSTGDSSSGRAPLTPRDGSDIGTSNGKVRDRGARERISEKEPEGWGSGVSGLGTTKPKHTKRKSVNFDEGVDEGRSNAKGKVPEENSNSREERRKERRRSEARAAIELGNVINGRGPIVDDDDDDEDDDEDDMPINQAMNARMSAMNPMMGPMPMQQTGAWPGMNMNMPMGMWPQSAGAGPQMLSPAAFMIPPPATNDPAYIAAHQQAMMYAKQAYQMAVAQQAMAAAADEWERGSTFGGGSVYGGGSSASVMNMPVSSPYGMMPMGMMNMQAGMNMNNGWSTGSVIFPSSSRSMYNGATGPMNSSRSEYGGGGGGRNWSSSRTSYGEFGPSPGNRMSRAGDGRESGYFPPMPPMPKEKESSNRAAARSRTASQPAHSTKSSGNLRKAPPSSWKAGI